MNRRTVIFGIGGLILVALIAAVGLGLVYLNGGSSQASGTITAPTLAASGATQRHFSVDSSRSKVSFTLTEDLFGKPNTVVGSTNQVAADIQVDVDHPANSQIGALRINARTLATDSNMRDQMMRRAILNSSENKYEYITFAPTAITGLPDKVVAGQSYTFQVAGNLTVKDVTKPVTFNVTAQLVGDATAHLDGSATATVKRADFNLQIPSVPTVANVSDEVKLQIDFVAPEVSGTGAATPAATKAS